MVCRYTPYMWQNVGFTCVMQRILQTSKLHNLSNLYYVSALCGGLASPSELCGSCTSQSYRDQSTVVTYILHNISSIYVHIRRHDVQAICMCLPPQFLYSRIIVKIWIKTPIFAHIILKAISPYPNLRF